MVYLKVCNKKRHTLCIIYTCHQTITSYTFPYREKCSQGMALSMAMCFLACIAAAWTRSKACATSHTQPRMKQALSMPMSTPAVLTLSKEFMNRRCLCRANFLIMITKCLMITRYHFQIYIKVLTHDMTWACMKTSKWIKWVWQAMPPTWPIVSKQITQTAAQMLLESRKYWQCQEGAAICYLWPITATATQSKTTITTSVMPSTPTACICSTCVAASTGQLWGNPALMALNSIQPLNMEDETKEEMVDVEETGTRSMVPHMERRTTWWAGILTGSIPRMNNQVKQFIRN